MQTETIELPPTRRSVEIEQPEIADARAHRISIPMNLDNWKHRSKDEVEMLTWFHQYIISEKMEWGAVESGVGYDKSVLNRILNGNYEGSWANVLKAITSWRKIINLQAPIPEIQFAPNCVTDRIDWILNYTHAAHKMSLMLGESGIGKNAGTEHWVKDNNHGRSVFVECHAIGGATGLLRQISEQVGVGRRKTTETLDAVTRAFNKQRILIINEIQHEIPLSGCRPRAIEMLRRIHDISGCGLCLIGTYRVEEELKETNYMYEQIIGRTGKTFYLPNKFAAKDILGIVTQFIKNPTESFMETMLAWCNDRTVGHIRYMKEIFLFATHMAHRNKKPLTEDYILAAHKRRQENCGFKPGAIHD